MQMYSLPGLGTGHSVLASDVTACNYYMHCMPLKLSLATYIERITW